LISDGSTEAAGVPSFQFDDRDAIAELVVALAGLDRRRRLP